MNLLHHYPKRLHHHQLDDHQRFDLRNLQLYAPTHHLYLLSLLHHLRGLQLQDNHLKLYSLNLSILGHRLLGEQDWMRQSNHHQM